MLLFGQKNWSILPVFNLVLPCRDGTDAGIGNKTKFCSQWNENWWTHWYCPWGWEEKSKPERITIGHFYCGQSSQVDNFRPLVGDTMNDELQEVVRDLRELRIYPINAMRKKFLTPRLIQDELRLIRSLVSSWFLFEGALRGGWPIAVRSLGNVFILRRNSFRKSGFLKYRNLAFVFWLFSSTSSGKSFIHISIPLRILLLMPCSLGGCIVPEGMS